MEQQTQEAKQKMARPLLPETLTSLAYPPLKMAAFNIQVFGRQKMRDRDITKILVFILSRYDIVLIQEIRDSSETALDKLVRQLNDVDPENPFDAVVSEKLGRSRCKEQYAFLYRPSRVTVADTYQYDDGEDNGQDTFQREPFAVRFSCPNVEVDDFAIIAIHTDPDDAVKEIGALHKVYEGTKKHWGGLADIIIAGDFNADEGYVNRDDWSKIALKNDRRFKWLIDDTEDTTVKNTDRAYDRFVVAGKRLMSSVVPGSTGVFRFDQALNLTPEEAEDVSDHYPIEMELMGKINRELQIQLSSSVAFTVTQKNENDVSGKEILRDVVKQMKSGSGGEFMVVEKYNVNGDIVEVVFNRKDVNDVMVVLEAFQQEFPTVLFSGTLEMARAYLNSDTFASRPYVNGLLTDSVSKDRIDFDVTIRIAADEPCSVLVEMRMS